MHSATFEASSMFELEENSRFSEDYDAVRPKLYFLNECAGHGDHRPLIEREGHPESAYIGPFHSATKREEAQHPSTGSTHGSCKCYARGSAPAHTNQIDKTDLPANSL